MNAAGGLRFAFNTNGAANHRLATLSLLRLAAPATRPTQKRTPAMSAQQSERSDESMAVRSAAR